MLSFMRNNNWRAYYPSIRMSAYLSRRVIPGRGTKSRSPESITTGGDLRAECFN